eukprot:gene33452-43190_t
MSPASYPASDAPLRSPHHGQHYSSPHTPHAPVT